jgi:hypothetical protein
VLRWRPEATIGLAGGNVLVAATVTAGLRPQLLLFSYVPLAWALAALLGRSHRVWPAALGLIALGAASVNSHLFFPLLLAPIPALWATGHLPVRRGLVAGAAIAAGWLVTPYAPDWIALLRNVTTPYATYRQPPIIQELQPGFSILLNGKLIFGWLSLGLLLPLPWLAGHRLGRRAGAICLAVYWSIGLFAFGYAARLIAAWWLVTFPFYGEALRSLRSRPDARPARPGVKLIAYGGMAAVCAAMLTVAGRTWSQEGSVTSRRLSTVTSTLVEPLAKWLVQNTRPRSTGRVFTTFGFGSYITWRLPGYSASIDSRGSFPDSVVVPELWTGTWRPPPPLGPWRSAELAVVPTGWQVAAALDTARGWRRVATSVDTTTADSEKDTPPDSVGLWVTEAWWARAGRGPLSGAPTVLLIDRDGPRVDGTRR